jgi:hypothetical protein
LRCVPSSTKQQPGNLSNQKSPFPADWPIRSQEKNQSESRIRKETPFHSVSSAYLPPPRGTLTGMFNDWVWSLANVTAKASCSRSSCVRVNGMFNALVWSFDFFGKPIRFLPKSVSAYHYHSGKSCTVLCKWWTI